MGPASVPGQTSVLVTPAGIPALGGDKYKKLREKTPTAELRKMVNTPPPLVCPTCDREVESLEADHSVSMKSITNMPGFASLGQEQQLQILNWGGPPPTGNFQGLCKNCNASKGAREWGDWKGHKTLKSDQFSEVSQQMKGECDAIRSQVQQMIDGFGAVA